MEADSKLSPEAPLWESVLTYELSEDSDRLICLHLLNLMFYCRNVVSVREGGQLVAKMVFLTSEGTATLIRAK